MYKKETDDKKETHYHAQSPQSTNNAIEKRILRAPEWGDSEEMVKKTVLIQRQKKVTKHKTGGKAPARFAE